MSSDKQSMEGAQLIGKAIALLDYVSNSGADGARINDISAELGMSAPTVYRIVRALEAHGWLERIEQKKAVQLGIALFALGTKAADGAGMRSLCRPSLLRICDEIGETVFLMCRHNFEVIVIDRIWGGYKIPTLTENVGNSMPLGIGSGSMALLACMPRSEQDEILRANEHLYRDYGITYGEVKALIEATVEKGYAESTNILIAGITGLAVAIRAPSGRPLATIAVNMATEHLTEARKNHVLRLLKAEVEHLQKVINK